MVTLFLEGFGFFFFQNSTSDANNDVLLSKLRRDSSDTVFNNVKNPHKSITERFLLTAKLLSSPNNKNNECINIGVIVVSILLIIVEKSSSFTYLAFNTNLEIACESDLSEDL